MLCNFGSLQKLLPTFATTFVQSGLYTFIRYSVISFHNNGDILKISSIVKHRSSPCIAWYLGAFGNCRVLSFLGGGVGGGRGGEDVQCYRHTCSAKQQKLLLTNLGHLAEFFKVSSYQVEERQFVKVLCPLVSHFYNLLNNKLKCMLLEWTDTPYHLIFHNNLGTESEGPGVGKKSIQEKFTWINAYSWYVQKNEHTSRGKYTHGETKNFLAKQNLPQPLHFSNGLSLIILLNRLKQETKLNNLWSVHTFCHTLSREHTMGQWDNPGGQSQNRHGKRNRSGTTMEL